MIVATPSNDASGNKNGSYSERFVAFVDILGFSSLVRRADQDGDLRKTLIEVLYQVRSAAAPSEEHDSHLQSQNFSDSLIVSANSTPDGLWHLLLSLNDLAWSLLKIGVLVRGAVTMGMVYHDDEVVFGPGVNDAYGLELSVAKVPRIILGSRAIEAAQTFATQEEIWKAYANARLLRDSDGVWFLNVLTNTAIFNTQDSNNPDMKNHPAYLSGEIVRQKIQEKVDSTVDNPEVYAKVEWLAKYWNSEVVDRCKEGMVPVLGRIVLAGQVPRVTPLPFRTYPIAPEVEK